MNYLFVHNNFPAQFRNVARRLASGGDRVAAIGSETATDLDGVRLHRYKSPVGDLSATHVFARRFDMECRRAEQVLFAASALSASGFTPDVVFAHCGWGENLPLRVAFPRAKLVIYCEYFYRPEGQDVHFEAERARLGIDGLAGVQCGNASTLIALAECDMGISPTRWQQSTYPKEFRKKIHVIHEGIDVDRIRPNPFARFDLPGGRKLSRDHEVVTYVSRSLEPMRGFHIFMRAAAEILKARPHAEVVIVGVERPSYGPSPPDGTNWKRFCLNETLASIDLSRVHFIDRLPYEQYLTLLQISSAHVYLTYPFVLSWSLIEAMAAGCVIVGSDTEPVREAITHEVNGVLASFHDSNAIARAVTAILAQPAAHAHLGVAARETAIRNYDERKCVPEALRLLNMNTLDPAAAGAGNSGAKTVAE